MKGVRKTFLILPAILLLAACGSGERGHTQDSGEHNFTSDAYGIAISVPADFDLREGFAGSYLQNGNWKTYAGPNSRGQPIVALVLDGSNAVTDAELRIGASRNSEAVSDCTKPPAARRPGSLGYATLNGVDFTTFRAADAAMSHYLQVRSYRAVHEGTCYAIDLLVYGTNPEVYDPPREAPFTREAAFRRLQAALRGFRFTH